VLARQRHAVGLVGDEHVVGHERLEREVGRVVAGGVDEDVGGRWPRTRALDELAHPHAAEARVEARPARDAVQVGRQVDLLEALQLLPAQRVGRIGLAVDRQRPVLERHLGVRPHREHRPLQRRRLARREPREVDAELLGALAAALAEDARRQLHAPASARTAACAAATRATGTRNGEQET